MNNNKPCLCCFFTRAAAFVLTAAVSLLMVYSVTAADLSPAPRPLLVLIDTSGSMQEKTTTTDPAGEIEIQTKADAAQVLSARLIDVFQTRRAALGVFCYRYLSGDDALLDVFMPIGLHEKRETVRRIVEEFETSYPVFNRRSPLADSLRRLADQFSGLFEKPLDLLVITDGRECFYNLKKDADRAGTGDEIDPAGDVVGPQTEVLRLKALYGDDLVLHTVFVPTRRESPSVFAGHALLKRMAELGGGESRVASALLEDPEELTAFAETIAKTRPKR
jgi:hypothetical protein